MSFCHFVIRPPIRKLQKNYNNKLHWICLLQPIQHQVKILQNNRYLPKKKKRNKRKLKTINNQIRVSNTHHPSLLNYLTLSKDLVKMIKNSNRLRVSKSLKGKKQMSKCYLGQLHKLRRTMRICLVSLLLIQGMKLLRFSRILVQTITRTVSQTLLPPKKEVNFLLMATKQQLLNLQLLLIFSNNKKVKLNSTFKAW